MISFFDKPQVSQARKELKPLILDEGCQVLSTFELNKIASLTFGDLVCDEIFDLIESIIAKPLDHTPLTIQKTLVMMKHVLIYGSEKCVNSAYGIGAFVDQLQTFNTVLMAQQQQGARAMWQRLQGGGVDRGGPVREAAKEVHKLLSNIHELQRIRNASAAKDSLVPIGDDKVAFISDDVRHFLLRKKIQEQQRIQIKSNLAKSEGGFGGGYNATDGKNFVGAAHGIEEMIKMAQMEKKKWSDDGTDSAQKTEEMRILAELKAQADAEKAEAKRRADEAAAAHNVDLLGSFGGSQPQQSAQEVDLLDFGGGGTTEPSSTTQPTTTTDLMGTHDFFAPTPAAPSASSDVSSDLLGLGMTDMSQPSAISSNANNTMDIFGYSATAAPSQTTSTPSTIVDPFAPISAPAPSQPPEQPLALPLSDPTLTAPTQEQPRALGEPVPAAGVNDVTSQLTTMSLAGAAAQPKKSIMGSNADRFAALDALASTSAGPTSKVTELDRKNAENRILGLTSGGSSSSTNFSLAITSGGAPPAAPPTVPTGMPPPPPPDDSPAALGMSHLNGSASGSYNNNDNFNNTHEDSLLAMTMGMPPAPPPEPVVVNPASVRIGQTYGDAPGGVADDDDEDNPWVMGGVSGSGLEPVAPAPGAPPPPPP